MGLGRSESTKYTILICKDVSVWITNQVNLTRCRIAM